MPPHVRLSDQESARLPALLKSKPAKLDALARCRSTLERVLWVLDAYRDAAGNGLTPNLIALLLFECGVSLALPVIDAALREASSRRLATETGGAWTAGR